MRFGLGGGQLAVGRIAAGRFGARSIGWWWTTTRWAGGASITRSQSAANKSEIH
jgi:hypothetical protein